MSSSSLLAILIPPAALFVVLVEQFIRPRYLAAGPFHQHVMPHPPQAEFADVGRDELVRGELLAQPKPLVIQPEADPRLSVRPRPKPPDGAGLAVGIGVP